ncbi:MAG: hypothetical protein R3Y29_01670 [bacterium]
MKKSNRLIITLLASSLILVGCDGGNNQETSSKSENIVGYIYIQDDKLMIDEVEIVKIDNKERVQELGLVESEDYPSGYYIYNKQQEVELFKLTDDTNYIFTDIKQLYVDEEIENKLYESKIVEQFIEGSSYQNIELDDIELDKHYIPYFVEVLDGEVISVKEEFSYTM